MRFGLTLRRIIAALAIFSLVAAVKVCFFHSGLAPQSFLGFRK
jgi:lipopolysaccharide export LptBFGC system permease protein LptF